MNADALAQQQTGRRRTGLTMLDGNESSGGEGAGRPEKSDDEKSTKTLQNIESQN